MADEFSKVIAMSRIFRPIFRALEAMSAVIAIPCKIANFSQKPKFWAVNALLRVFFFTVFCLLPGLVGAQIERPVRTPTQPLPVRTDTVPQMPPSDSLQLVGQKSDSTRQKRDSDIETTIIYSARDSINISIEKKIIWLYGNAKIKYGIIELEAEEIVIDYNKSTISANGKLDSLGRRAGFPIFKNGAEVYETKSINYNFKTKKAAITEVITTQGDAFLHGKTVFKNERGELYSASNAYTTCNRGHPHYRIMATKVKAIPGDKMVAGPFYMEFNDVPTPLGFAFGMFPNPRKSASGVIVPQYGEEQNRGFFLRRGGYFFDVSEYLKIAVTGDIYSRGANAIYLNTNYNKLYHYSGSFNFSYTTNPTSNQIENTTRSRDFLISWSHSPQSRGTGRFSASVNASTSSFTNNNFLGVNTNPQSMRVDNITRKLSSNISYSKTFAGTPFSMGVNLRHSQDLRTGEVSFPLPDLNFNVNNLYPFKRSSIQALENFSTRLTMTAINEVTNNLGPRIVAVQNGTPIYRDSIAKFNLDNLPTFLKNANKGIRFDIPLQTSVKLLRFFTLSPSVSMNERWYFNKLLWDTVSVRDTNSGLFTGSTPTVVDTLNGFNRINNFSGSLALNTRIYGTYSFKSGRVKALRHVINPSVGFSFQPDFGEARFDYYQTLAVRNGSRITEQRRSRHEGFVYGGSTQGRQSALNFSINNTLEMKVKNKKDSLFQKIPLFNTLSIATSYNFAADSFKLAPFGIAANTNILNEKINLNITATIDPYQYIKVNVGTSEKPVFQEIKVSRYAWNGGKGIGQLSQATLVFGTNLNPKGQKKDNEFREKVGASNASDADKQFLLKNPDAYVDFSIPWNLRLNYSFNYSKTGSQPSNITQSLQFSGDFSLSEKWKIQFNSGYDFESNQFTQTSVSLNRDLHCWQMSLSWVPFGPFQSYGFNIGIKSSMLQDLKLNRTRSFFDN